MILNEVVYFEDKLIKKYGSLGVKLSKYLNTLKGNLEIYEAPHDVLMRVLVAMDQCEDMDDVKAVEDRIKKLMDELWD